MGVLKSGRCWATPGSDSGITPGGLTGLYGMLLLEPRMTTCKASALPDCAIALTPIFETFLTKLKGANFSSQMGKPISNAVS